MLGAEEEVAVGAEFLDLDDGGDALVVFDGEEVDDGRALCLPSALGDFVGFQDEGAPAIRKEEDVVVRGGDEEVADDVGFLGPHAAHADAAAPLAAVGVERNALDVVVQGEGDDDVFLSDEVFDVHLARVKGDLRAAFVAVFVAHFDELVFDDGEDFRAVGEDAFEFFDQF